MTKLTRQGWEKDNGQRITRQGRDRLGRWTTYRTRRLRTLARIANLTLYSIITLGSN